MTSITHGHGTALNGGETRGRTTQHPYFSTIAVMLAAIVCGVLAGILFNLVMSGAEPAAVHRGGGHAKVAAVNQSRSLAAEAGPGIALSGFAFSWERSPARGGFAAGRSFAGTGSAEP